LSKIDNKLDYLTYDIRKAEPISLPDCVLRHNKNKSIHFIGMGGIGMSGIAKILSELNYKISGSDIKDSPTLFSMAERGATVFVGHHEDNINDAGLIVVSSAISGDNPEIIAAKRNNIPIVHRAQMLSLIVSGNISELTNQVSIGITGTHGKTTTSGMVGLMFEYAGMKPTIVVGGQMPVLNTNSKLGAGTYFIAELDESDGTITLYKPDIRVITNLELDHSDHYIGGMDQLFDTFEKYINNLPGDATVIINLDSEGNRKLLEKLPEKSSKILTYSIEEDSPHFNKAKFKAIDIKTEGFKSSFKVLYDNDLFGEIEIIIPGKHNISNTLSAIAVGIEAGLGLEKVLNGISKFSGMRRRFQIIGEINNAKIVDDYAHHPTEISATLLTAKQIVKKEGGGRVVAVFQPHRYTRLSCFWDDFRKCFKNADVVYICDVYSANEKPIKDINSEKLSKCMEHNDVHYISGPIEQVAENIKDQIKPSDLVLTLGAGNITKLGNILLEKIEKK